MSICYLNSSDTGSVLLILLLLIALFHRIEVIFFHQCHDIVFVRFFVLDEEGPATATHKSGNLTVAVIYVTSLVAFISWSLEHYLGFILIFQSLVSLVHDTVDVNIIEVSLAIVATDDQDLIVAPE